MIWIKYSACMCFRVCEAYFGAESLQRITMDDDVICVTQFSKVVPLEGGEVSFPEQSVVNISEQ